MVGSAAAGPAVSPELEALITEQDRLHRAIAAVEGDNDGHGIDQGDGALVSLGQQLNEVEAKISAARRPEDRQGKPRGLDPLLAFTMVTQYLLPLLLATVVAMVMRRITVTTGLALVVCSMLGLMAALRCGLPLEVLSGPGV